MTKPNIPELFVKQQEPILARSVKYDSQDVYKNATMFDLLKAYPTKRNKIDDFLKQLHEVNKNESHIQIETH
jgi:hypothetical protein